MDNKGKNLDPQLQAAYERVMGTNTQPAPTPTPAPAANSKKDAENKIVAGSAGGRKVSPILIAVAVLLFFVVYAIVWVKIFNLQIPFLPF